MTETKMIKPIETVYHGYRFRSRKEARLAVLLDTMGWDWEYEVEGYELPDGTWYLPDFLLHGVYLAKGDSFMTGAERRRLGDVYIEVKGEWTDEDWAKTFDFARAGNNVLTVEDILYPGEIGDYLYRTISNEMRNFQNAHKRMHCFTFLGKSEPCTDCSPNCEWDLALSKQHGSPYGRGGMCPVKYNMNMGLFASALGGRSPIIGQFDPYEEKIKYIPTDPLGPSGHGPVHVDWFDYGMNVYFERQCDIEFTRAAYTAARQARFEHGETPRTTNAAL